MNETFKNICIGFIFGMLFIGAVILTGYYVTTGNSNEGDDGFDPNIELARLIDRGFSDNSFTREELRRLLEKSIDSYREHDAAYQELLAKYEGVAGELKYTTGELGIARRIIDGSIESVGKVIEGVGGLEGKSLAAKRELLEVIKNYKLLQKVNEDIRSGGCD